MVILFPQSLDLGSIQVHTLNSGASATASASLPLSQDLQWFSLALSFMVALCAPLLYWHKCPRSYCFHMCTCIPNSRPRKIFWPLPTPQRRTRRLQKPLPLRLPTILIAEDSYSLSWWWPHLTELHGDYTVALPPEPRSIAISLRSQHHHTPTQPVSSYYLWMKVFPHWSQSVKSGDDCPSNVQTSSEVPNIIISCAGL